MPNPGKLLARVAEGDKKAFEILFTIFQTRFVAVARSITGELSSAEDAVQEAFVRVLRFASDADGREDPDAWLFRICVNCARDEAERARKGRGRVWSGGTAAWTAESSTPLLSTIAEEEHEILSQEIQGLRRDLRTALTLRFTADLAYEQMAKVLAIPLGTVQSRLHAAVKKLRERVVRRVGGVRSGPRGSISR